MLATFENRGSGLLCFSLAPIQALRICGARLSEELSDTVGRTGLSALRTVVRRAGFRCWFFSGQALFDRRTTSLRLVHCSLPWFRYTLTAGKLAGQSYALGMRYQPETLYRIIGACECSCVVVLAWEALRLQCIRTDDCQVAARHKSPRSAACPVANTTPKLTATGAGHNRSRPTESATQNSAHRVPPWPPVPKCAVRDTPNCAGPVEAPCLAVPQSAYLADADTSKRLDHALLTRRLLD